MTMHPRTRKGTVGARIRRAREALGLTLDQASALFGGSRITWLRDEGRDHLPRTALLQSLLDEGFSRDWLLLGTGHPPTRLRGKDGLDICECSHSRAVHLGALGHLNCGGSRCSCTRFTWSHRREGGAGNR